jgi:hypothetical protein
VGFPIRISADQSFFAAPHGFSQRSTSFIASQRQGIHRMPLRHLIALIINAHPLGSGTNRAFLRKACSCEQALFGNSSTGWSLIRKTSLSSDRSDGVRSSSRHKHCARPPRTHLSARRRVALQCSEIAYRSRLASRSILGAILPLHDVRYQSVITRSARSLTAHARARNCVRRTSLDLEEPHAELRFEVMITMLQDDRARSRLVEPDGIEPTTSCLQSRRSPN